MTSIERLYQPRLAFLIVLALGISQYAVLIFASIGGAPNFVLGGDFVAFWAASREIIAGNLTGLYTPDGLDAAIQAHRPGADVTGLTWQYPPHASLIFSPMGYLPYTVAYSLWCGLGVSIFTAILLSIGFKGRFLIALLATIPIVIALNTGQNALFTGSLLLVAVLYAKPRPLIAGLAAGLLTIKPQLGILLPILFIAGGHWRAIVSAAIVTIALCSWSYLVAGAETWTSFFEYLSIVSGSVADGVMPLYKMVNVFSAARLAQMPEAIAIALTLLSFAASILAIVWTVRNTKDSRWHYAVLAPMTLLTTPYSMYYELALIVPALAFVVLHGVRTQWLSWERESIAAVLFISLVLPGPATQIGVSIGFLICLATVLIVLRRIRSVILLGKQSAETPA